MNGHYLISWGPGRSSSHRTAQLSKALSAGHPAHTLPTTQMPKWKVSSAKGAAREEIGRLSAKPAPARVETKPKNGSRKG